MAFPSIEFLFLFLPVFLVAYFGFLGGANAILLSASLLFYLIGEGWFVLVMAASILGNFLLGKQIGQAGGQNRTRWLVIGVVANLLLLTYYKYVGFLITSIFPVSEPTADMVRGIHLPLGISFFTFQALSYLVDVYRQETKAETSVVRLGTYIAMFPQLVAGPIVRFSTVADSLQSRQVSLQHLYYGLGFFAIGLAAKVLIADGVSGYADQVFNTDPASLRADTALLGILIYALQIYFDFLGYSAMAVGLGFALGFTFPRNFNFPYVSQSLTEFWRRWHMSLSTWFRDYVYIPLGGNRGSAVRVSINLWIVFLLTGFWHGAAWNFIFWGMFHGAFLTFERLGGAAILRACPRVLRHLYLLGVVAIGWVLFRANDLSHALDYLGALTRMQGEMSPWTYLTNEMLGTVVIGIAFCTPQLARWVNKVAELPRYKDWPNQLPRGRVVIGVLIYAVLLGLCVAKILAGSYSPFIYFRF
ncbi:MAG: MBOAT family O-acyltransferase [Sulfitobacter sp.]